VNLPCCGISARDWFAAIEAPRSIGDPTGHLTCRGSIADLFPASFSSTAATSASTKSAITVFSSGAQRHVE